MDVSSQFLLNKVNSYSQMLNVLESLLVGVIGGIVGGFGAKWTYRVFSRPRLHCARKGSRKFVDTDDGMVVEHRVRIKNTGNSPAKNCKIELLFLGHQNQQSSKYTYQVESTSFWAEPDNPTRLTINPGEFAEAVIYKYTWENNRPSIMFPADGCWPENTRNVLSYTFKNDEIDRLDFEQEILLPHFQKIDTEQFILRVTANRIKELESNLKVIEEADSMGVQGEKLFVNQIRPAPPKYP